MRILIRNVTAEDAQAERYRAAFRSLPPALWQIFDEPTEIRAALPRERGE